MKKNIIISCGFAIAFMFMTFLSLRTNYYNNYVSEHASKISDIEKIVIKNIDPSSPNNNTFVLDNKTEIDKVIRCLEFHRNAVMPCGYDYQVILYRADNSAAYMDINTECGYFTSNIPELYDIKTESNFYSFSGTVGYVLNKYISIID